MKTSLILFLASSIALGQGIPGVGDLGDLLRTAKSARDRSQSTARTATPPAYPAFSGQNRTKIPVVKGLTIVTAIYQEGRDFESIKRLTDVSVSSVKLHYSAEHPVQGHIDVDREVRREDLKNARKYHLDFDPQGQEVYAGSTSLGISSLVLDELKSRGESAFTFDTGNILNVGDLVGGVLSAVAGSKRGAQGSGGGKLKLLSKTPVGIPVVVNDSRVILPALHAQTESGDGDFYFLDDPDNPIALRWQLNQGDTLQAVKISFHSPQTGPHLEQQLAEVKRATVYGIYFDTASARIRPESEAVLLEIAEILRRNPSWNLQVEGHTDNIGGESYNLDLSKQRSAAVRKSLIEKYGVAAERLTSTGFGATRPKASNDTLDGRAQNRRVELIRPS